MQVIQTSYELLWDEIKEAGQRKRATIFNTLRRVLEYYFRIVGGIDYEKCIGEFDGEDKIACKALLSSSMMGLILSVRILQCVLNLTHLRTISMYFSLYSEKWGRGIIMINDYPSSS